MPQLDSRTSPIEVHFVPSSELPLKGRVGFTLAPGRKGPGTAGKHDRDLDADMDRLRREYGVTLPLEVGTPHPAKQSHRRHQARSTIHQRHAPHHNPRTAHIQSRS